MPFFFNLVREIRRWVSPREDGGREREGREKEENLISHMHVLINRQLIDTICKMAESIICISFAKLKLHSQTCTYIHAYVHRATREY